MNFNDILAIWAKLQGKVLPSIRKGAEIQIIEVDYQNLRIVVASHRGRKSRPFAELDRVWKALSQQRTVHVDSVLSGSGSSRNQPETLFANLPVVEWMRFDRRKHLLLRDEATHANGTLREVDSVTAALVRAGTAGQLAPRGVEIVLPVSNIKEVARVLRDLTGVEGIAESQGEYLYRVGSVSLRVVREASVAEPFRGRIILRARGLLPTAGSSSAEVAGRKGQAVNVSDNFVVLDEDR